MARSITRFRARRYARIDVGGDALLNTRKLTSWDGASRSDDPLVIDLIVTCSLERSWDCELGSLSIKIESMPGVKLGMKLGSAPLGVQLGVSFDCSRERKLVLFLGPTLYLSSNFRNVTWLRTGQILEHPSAFPCCSSIQLRIFGLQEHMSEDSDPDPRFMPMWCRTTGETCRLLRELILMA
jgi:hypothetical protein